MKHKLLHVVLLLMFLLSGGVSAYGQSSPLPVNKKPRTQDDYGPRTLKEIAATGTTAGGQHDEANKMILHGNVLPSRVRVTYTGSSRPLPRNRRDVLAKWAARFAGDPAHYTVPYDTEMLFIENGAKHWLAVRKNFAAQAGKKLKKGEAVYLYLIRLGGVRTGDGWEWLMLVENYLPAN
ncbi:MAG TPA: hypothetical protein VK363_18390 [Pyrinomonadaceae bacterium]|nr:hypothetical protein [Pyrinomonadaceae bacterium]